MKKAVALFQSLTFDLPMPEFAALLKHTELEFLPLYVYDADSRSVELVRPLEVPWFISFYLCCFHKKHVFNYKRCSGTMKEVGDALRHLCNRIRWRHNFKDAPEAGVELDLRSKRSEVAPFSRAPDEKLEAILSGFATEIYEECMFAVRRHRAPGNSRLYALAMDRLSKTTWAAVPTDKDGGFCLVDKLDLAREYRSILSSAAYQPCHLDSSFRKELIDEYVHTCKEAADFIGDEGPFYKALLSSLAAKNPRVFGKLNVTIKTHKPAGLVKFRAIHASGGLAYAPAMTYITGLLDPVLRSLPHLMLDSNAVVRYLACTPFPATVRMYRFDIDEFFMTGEQPSFIKSALKHIPLETHHAFRKLCSFVLSTLLWTESHPLFGRQFEAQAWGTSAQDTCRTLISTTERRSPLLA